METPETDIQKTLAPGDWVRWTDAAGTVRSYVVVEHEGRVFMSRDYMILSESQFLTVERTRKALATGATPPHIGGRLEKVYDHTHDVWLEDGEVVDRD